MQKTVLILISGKSGSGKGTVAEELTKFFSENIRDNVIRCSLSTYVRTIAKQDFYWDGIDTPESRKFMAELYRVGTEFYPYHMARRVWERDIEPELTSQCNIVIVESFREIVNYEYFMQLWREDKINGIITIRVERPEHVSTQKLVSHVSETDLDGFEFDYYINNCGTLQELKDTVFDIADIIEEEIR